MKFHLVLTGCLAVEAEVAQEPANGEESYGADQ